MCLFRGLQLTQTPFHISGGRMPVLCSSKCGAKAILKRPKTGDALCKVSPFSITLQIVGIFTRSCKQGREANCAFMTLLHYNVTGMFLLGFWDWGTLHHSKGRAFQKGKKVKHNICMSVHISVQLHLTNLWLSSLLKYFRVTMLQSERQGGRTQRCWHISWKPSTTDTTMGSSWSCCP